MGMDSNEIRGQTCLVKGKTNVAQEGSKLALLDTLKRHPLYCLLVITATYLKL
jgi:hypothetical protein